jgi:hypothetical protein
LNSIYIYIYIYIYIGTWNVLNLLKPGEIQELAEQAANTQLEMAAIQETRWSGNGLIKRNNYSLY